MLDEKTLGPRLASRFMNTVSPKFQIMGKIVFFFFFFFFGSKFLFPFTRGELFFLGLPGGGPPFVSIFLVKILLMGGSNSFFFSWASVLLD